MASGSLGELTAAQDAVNIRLDEFARDASLAIHRAVGNPNVVTPRDARGECALKNEPCRELKDEA